MVARRKSKTPAAHPERLSEWAVEGAGGKKRWLKPEMTIKVQGVSGEFRIKYIGTDGLLTCWGGTKHRQSMRSFRADQLKQVVRNTRARAEALDVASES